MSTAVARTVKISKEMQEANDKLALAIGFNPFAKIFEKAEKIMAVQDWLGNDEVMKRLVRLKGTASGFKTDETPNNKYGNDVVALAVTEALTNGFDLCGNEMNIIKGNFYGTLNGYRRKCQTFEDEKIQILSIELEEGDIKINGNIVQVPLKAFYRFLNKETKEKGTGEMARTISLKSFASDTPDLWIGKASRRLYKKLFERFSGLDFGDEDGIEPGQGAAAAQMPMGPMSLKKEDLMPLAAALAPVASDAVFQEVVGKKTDPAPEALPKHEAPAPITEPQGAAAFPDKF